jgi:hypothetical protein
MDIENLRRAISDMRSVKRLLKHLKCGDTAELLQTAIDSGQETLEVWEAHTQLEGH